MPSAYRMLFVLMSQIIQPEDLSLNFSQCLLVRNAAFNRMAWVIQLLFPLEFCSYQLVSGADRHSRNLVPSSPFSGDAGAAKKEVMTGVWSRGFNSRDLR